MSKTDTTFSDIIVTGMIVLTVTAVVGIPADEFIVKPWLDMRRKNEDILKEKFNDEIEYYKEITHNPCIPEYRKRISPPQGLKVPNRAVVMGEEIPIKIYDDSDVFPMPRNDHDDIMMATKDKPFILSKKGEKYPADSATCKAEMEKELRKPPPHDPF